MKKRKSLTLLKPRRPHDVNQLAHQLVRESTEHPAQEATDAEISKVMSALGKRGGKIGGKRRAEALSAKQRKEIALKAARARWDKPSH